MCEVNGIGVGGFKSVLLTCLALVQNVYAVLSLDPGLHIHTSLPRLNVSFSNRAYNAIMNFVGGNLVEGNSFEAPVLPPARKLSTKYRHAQAFGPPAGDKASVRVTVFASTLQLYLLAQPSRWENQATEENSPATPSGQEDAQAFLRIRLTNFIINLGMLQPSGNLHIDLGSGGLEIDDLRFSSRPMPITKGRPENDTLREEESGQFKLLDVDFVQINDRPVFRSHEVPLVQIVQAPWDLPANESLHLDDEVRPGNAFSWGTSPPCSPRCLC